jgi:hypothetical protein
MISKEVAIFSFLLVICVLFIIWSISSTATAGTDDSVWNSSCPNYKECPCSGYNQRLKTSKWYTQDCKKCCGNKVAQSREFMKKNAKLTDKSACVLKGAVNPNLSDKEKCESAKGVWTNVWQLDRINYPEKINGLEYKAACPVGFGEAKSGSGKWVDGYVTEKNMTAGNPFVDWVYRTSCVDENPKCSGAAPDVCG